MRKYFSPCAIIFSGLASALTLSASTPEKNLCGDIYFKGKIPSFTATETRLLCGDEKNPAWDSIPRNQAIFHLQAFLSERGYHKPVFETRARRLIVEPGPLSRIRQVRFECHTDDVPFEQIRGVEGEILSPKALDKVKKLALQTLESHGYPCPEVEMKAVASEGLVIARILPGPKQTISEIVEDDLPGLKPRIFSRYHAFRAGDLYNADYLSVTVRRIVNQGLVHSTYFLARCEKKGATLHQHFVLGPPRLVTFGLGASTEHGPVIRASWKHGRLGPEASNVSLSAFFSLREQQLRGSSEWYWFPDADRFHLAPEISLQRRNETAYETYRLRLSLAPTATWDTSDTAALLAAGPSFEWSHTSRGTGPVHATALTLLAKLKLWSHYFEFYDSSPRTGYEVELGLQLAEQSLFSNATFAVFRLRGERHWNFRDYFPPWLIFSVRGLMATTFNPGGSQGASKLSPDEHRHFLGGWESLRGFDRKEIGASENGVLSAFHIGTEMRFADLLPLGLEPFALIDFGMIGEEPLQLKPPYFYSPGLGLRWESPIGVFRATLAHGFVAGAPLAYPTLPHWQGYISYGEEF